MKGSFRAAAKIVLIGLAALQVQPSAAQTSSVEYEVKAAFLYNFAKFVDWPARSFGRLNEAFTICVADEGFAGALEKVVQGETLNARRLAGRRIASPENMMGCHIIYIDSSRSRLIADMNALRDTPVLTVGETEEFINEGGMIRFIETGHRIHFQVNADAIERSPLKLSSRLLRLAEFVRPKRKG